jgi:hypothetical protein
MAGRSIRSSPAGILPVQASMSSEPLHDDRHRPRIALAVIDHGRIDVQSTPAIARVISSGSSGVPSRISVNPYPSFTSISISARLEPRAYSPKESPTSEPPTL